MRRVLLASMLAALPAAAQAQSSEFGIRGLGLPGRALSARAMGTAGGFALFDGESSVSPASLAYLPALTAEFTGMSDYRTSESPAGSASIRNFRFPQFLVGGPIKGLPLSASFSYSNYTTRDFSLAFASTVTLNGVPVGVIDTLESRGGVNDLRLAVAYRASNRIAIGVAGHVITGTNRVSLRRDFADTLYRPALQRAELSFAGFGMSIGVLAQPSRNLAVSLLARSDGHASVERDSTEVDRIDLPVTLGGGLRWRALSKVDVAGHVLWRNWSTASTDLTDLGGVGAVNTLEAAAGLEFIRNVRRPSRLPLRVGFRYAKLPFPVAAGGEPKEYGVSVGTGFSFAADRGILSVALERTWRSEDPGFSERAWILTTGVSVRP
ncbi:MAG TPA: hypothetical protein VFK09_01450 [Gemmatimonadales bacterium]|nr:hypothetical protein [Gemmatimonadales bacterium]